MYPMGAGASAYDRAITVFSPDGRLFQVEYAREAVKRGTTAVGIIYDSGVVLAVDKNITTPLIVVSSIEKTFKIDNHIAIATSGLVADARRLVSDARLRAQRNRMTYDEPISVFEITRDLCDIKQAYTQYGGVRPFGVSLLIAGVNEEPHLYETDPSGAFTGYRAAGIGSGKKDVEKMFEKEYKEGMSRDEALQMAVDAIVGVSESKDMTGDIDVAVLEVDKNYEHLGRDKLKQFIENTRNKAKDKKSGED